MLETPLTLPTSPPRRPSALPAAKCYSCLRVFHTRAAGPQPPVMSCALTDSLTVAGMPDGLIRLWRTEDFTAGALSGAQTLCACALQRPGDWLARCSPAVHAVCVSPKANATCLPRCPLLPAALLGLADCGPEGSHHGGNGAAAALESSASPKPPAAKKLRLQLPAGAAAAVDGSAGEGTLPRRPSLLSAAAAAAAAVPSIGVPRLERELERALKAFIRIKWGPAGGGGVSPAAWG